MEKGSVLQRNCKLDIFSKSLKPVPCGVYYNSSGKERIKSGCRQNV